MVVGPILFMNLQLQQTPSHLCITQMLKATPVEESGKRFVYIEASNEALDIQNEVVMAKALKDSAEYYLKFGNIDLDHITQIGAKQSIKDYHFYEIGRPVDVKIDGTKTFVKGEIFSGEGQSAERANQFWDSLTKQSPAQRWYPSIGGSVLGKSEEFDPETHEKRTLVTEVRWTNIGFSKTPVNANVAGVATVPIGALAKSFSGIGFDIAKALEAGYGSDSADLSGGGALRKQSLHGSPINYWDFRDTLAGAMVQKKLKNPGVKSMIEFAVDQLNLNRAKASEWVERFMNDMKAELKRRSKNV